MSEEKEFAFNIKEHIGVINTYSNGWTKELNLVEWNGNNAKFDIRDWEPSHEHMSRGITLHEEEAKTLAGLFFRLFAKDKSKVQCDDKSRVQNQGTCNQAIDSANGLNAAPSRATDADENSEANTGAVASSI